MGKSLHHGAIGKVMWGSLHIRALLGRSCGEVFTPRLYWVEVMWESLWIRFDGGNAQRESGHLVKVKCYGLNLLPWSSYIENLNIQSYVLRVIWRWEDNSYLQIILRLDGVVLWHQDISNFKWERDSSYHTDSLLKHVMALTIDPSECCHISLELLSL